MQQPATDASEYEPRLVSAQPSTTAVLRATVEQKDLANFFDHSFGMLAPAIAAQGANITGPAFGLYHGNFEDPLDIEVGFPVDRQVEQKDDVAASTLPAGRVARMTHAGAFDGLPASWNRLHRWVEEQGLTARSFQWEVYVTEPSPDMNPDDLRVELNVPLLD
ncbi:GyrI-like domain-containing protein [Streptomonospora litoralis]|uniref:Bacterial transcription activator, effector binding domain n=1 Tax=Streptomonospora litoralis TaxID=2498135 RepID=A0A4P6Q696_9ACTN|nr:GyrI-like domain-containing protein [Streptomonospora litoralis]QBI56288.1 Bacterial transcription activator, effector binding domain [Streptomonospora litoralis]